MFAWCQIVSLRGWRLKGKGKGVLGATLALLSHLKLPFPSLSNACHAGYQIVNMGRLQHTLGARGFSCAVSCFGQVLKSDLFWRLRRSCLLPSADETKLPVAREKNLWCPGYPQHEHPTTTTA